MSEEKKKITFGGDKLFGMEPWQFKSLLPIGVIILLIIMSLGLVILPKIEQIKKFGVDKSAYKQKISDINQKRAYIQSADESEIKNREEILLMAVPESKDIYFLLNVVSRLVSEYEFVVSGLSFSPGELKSSQGNDTNSLSRINFGLNLVGPKNRYIELVNGLENSLPILSLDGLETKIVGENLMDISLNLSTYFVPKLTKVDINKLSYTDLVMTKTEMETVEKVAGFKKIEGLYVKDSQLDSGKSFEEFEIQNPFLPID